MPERLVVGNEHAFLTWFYDGATGDRDAIGPEAVDEYLRTFSGPEGVLGAICVPSCGAEPARLCPTTKTTSPALTRLVPRGRWFAGC